MGWLMLLAALGTWLSCAPRAAQAPSPLGGAPLPPAAHPQTPPPSTSPAVEAQAPTATDAKRIPALTTFVQARTAEGRVLPVVNGSVLSSGDQFWLDLSVNEPMYVFVLYVATDASASLLYPPDASVPLVPAVPTRVPRDETTSFELDDQPGWERLLIVASREPLENSGADFARVVGSVRATNTWPEGLLALAPPEASPPGSSASTHDERRATRGLHLTQRPGLIESYPDAQGLLAIPLFIRHVARSSKSPDGVSP